MPLNKAQSEFFLSVIMPTNRGLSPSVLSAATAAGLVALDAFNTQRDEARKPFDPDGGLRAYAKAFREVCI